MEEFEQIKEKLKIALYECVLEGYITENSLYKCKKVTEKFMQDNNFAFCEVKCDKENNPESDFGYDKIYVDIYQQVKYKKIKHHIIL